MTTAEILILIGAAALLMVVRHVIGGSIECGQEVRAVEMFWRPSNRGVSLYELE